MPHVSTIPGFPKSHHHGSSLIKFGDVKLGAWGRVGETNGAEMGTVIGSSGTAKDRNSTFNCSQVYSRIKYTNKIELTTASINDVDVFHH